MNFHLGKIVDLKLIELSPFIDDRGSLTRLFCQDLLSKNFPRFDIRQSNLSINTVANTLRGFHYEKPPFTEQKILICISGQIHNIVIDLRSSSRTFMQSESYELTSKKLEALYIPSGCANAFLTLKDNCQVLYYHSQLFNEKKYAGFCYNDPAFDLMWPRVPEIISEKDLKHPKFSLEDINE